MCLYGNVTNMGDHVIMLWDSSATIGNMLVESKIIRIDAGILTPYNVTTSSLILDDPINTPFLSSSTFNAYKV